MPGSPQHNSPTPPSPPWTVASAQAALGDAAGQILAIAARLEEVHAGLPPPADINDRQEGRLPYDVATDILATIECVLEDDLRPAAEAMRRSALVTDAELERDYREALRREKGRT